MQERNETPATRTSPPTQDALERWDNEGGEIPQVRVPLQEEMDEGVHTRDDTHHIRGFQTRRGPIPGRRIQTRLNRAVQSPWWRTIRLACVRWSEVDGDQRAAAFAYYLLLSLLPLTILLVTAASLLVEREVATQAIVAMGNHHTVLTAEQELTAVEAIHRMLEARGTISLAAFPLLLWGALNFLSILIRTTNRVWRSRPYNWWRLPLKSLGLLFITVSAMFFGLLLPSWAQLILPWLTIHLNLPQGAFGLLLRSIPWLILFYVFLMVYRLAPSRPTKFSEVWHGALGATILIWLGQRLFLIFAASFSHFNMLYGALGGIVVFLLWLYLASSVGVFGICFCAARAEVRKLEKSIPKFPAGKK